MTEEDIETDIDNIDIEEAAEREEYDEGRESRYRDVYTEVVHTKRTAFEKRLLTQRYKQDETADWEFNHPGEQLPERLRQDERWEETIW